MRPYISFSNREGYERKDPSKGFREKGFERRDMSGRIQVEGSKREDPSGRIRVMGSGSTMIQTEGSE